ncbi:MAG: RNA pseudouridine synthase [Bacteroidaceae bacterium]|nr:RNA pseudouridine synthase [Bacteroidaceae bacterium]
MECLHRYTSDIRNVELPVRFNNPFKYTPHRLCELAAGELRRFVAADERLAGEVAKGKMMGVLVVRDAAGELGYLAAFSGLLGGSNVQRGFVPPVFDFQSPDGYFKREEAGISLINRQITDIKESAEYIAAAEAVDAARRSMDEQLDAMRREMRVAKERRDAVRASDALSAADDAALVRESQHLKAELKRLTQRLQQRVELQKERLALLDAHIDALKEERRRRSAALQEWLFDNFIMLNARGESRPLTKIFNDYSGVVPPAGAGECAAPKLLQYAYSHSLQPLCMAEFWLGASPVGEVRRDGCFYGSCKGKCEPILSFMLQGLEVDGFLCVNASAPCDIKILYEDEWLVVADKPSGVLSVPGKVGGESLQEWLVCHFGREDILVAHRLDMSTSGLLVAAKGIEAYKAMQALFARREVTKKYMALLDGVPVNGNGVISLPLSPDYLNRPSQKVDYASGKEAVTEYEVLSVEEYGGRRCALVALYPLTGRTHQLRVHCAHKDGLDIPIVGDELYGKSDRRLMLHAAHLRFVHPFTGNVVEFCSAADFAKDCCSIG